MTEINVLTRRDGDHEWVAYVMEPYPFEVRVYSSRDDMEDAVEWWCKRRGLTPKYVNYLDLVEAMKDKNQGTPEYGEDKED